MSSSFISKIAASVLLVGTLTACGGGGGDATPVAAVPAPTTFTVAGTAATGAAFGNATITITGSDGTSYPAAGEAPVVTGADGSYTVTLPLTAKPPFVVQAARDDLTLVSVVAEAKDTTTNITPVTNLIASRLSSSGDPTKLAAEIHADPTLIDLTKLTAKVAEVVALIKPVMDAVGDSTDPLNGNIQAAVSAGTGADQVLDSLSISITPSSASTVNIEVSVKQKQADGTQPTVIAFSGGTDATAPAAALPAVTAADLVPSGNAALIADFLKRMDACYALALTDRVSSSGTTAADIVAPECKDIFLGKDPTSFLDNGVVVSKTGAFPGIFNTNTGATFDRGSYEFTRANGDLVIAYRATNGAGTNSANYTLVVRADTDGKLRAIGNQYKYNGGVNAYEQLRTFINQPAATYYSTGYNLNVSNTVDAKRNSIFDRVEVTTPTGAVLTLKPSAGSSYLPLVKGNTLTSTNFVRIRSVYTDPANSAKNPADADTSLFFRSPPLADADIAVLPAQSTWKFDYFLAGNNGTTADATQYYKTRARAMTIAELQTQPLATLTDANIASIKDNSLSNANGGKYLPTPPTGPVTLSWDVAAGALAPTSIQIWGGATVSGKSISFNDSAGVASSSRTGDIYCSAASASDTHCDSSGNYVPGGFNSAHLWAVDARGRQFASFYAIYTVTIP
jgi:hypothetical protein